MIVKPIEIIAFVQDGLKAAEDDGEQEKSDDIKSLNTRRHRPAREQGAGHARDQQGAGNVEREQRPPAQLIGNPAARRQSEGKRHQREQAPDGQSQRFQPVRIFL
jgi:hypothetical protein